MINYINCSDNRWRTIPRALSLILSVSLLVGIGLFCPSTAYAKEQKSEVTGDIYLFSENEQYSFSEGASNSSEKPTGVFSVSGDISTISTYDGVTSFSVKRDYDGEEDGLSITYSYSNALLTATEEEWHLCEDKSKRVDIISLDEKIQNGVLILQTSKDGQIWVTDYIETNCFSLVPNRSDPFYETTDVQLANGCFYRVIVAYELERRIDPKKIAFVSVDQYERKRIVEVYKFYAFDETAQTSTLSSNTKRFNLGSKVRTEKFEGYYGSTTMTNKDPHYGWDIGQFFVSGYTDSVKDSEGNIIFLKNVGDQLTLWFNLLQDINALYGNDAITIMADHAGSDQYFETPTIDFRHGALIIRKTTYENIPETPVIYTNYLEASATVGAETRVNLFEEGDYEVALDYAINYDKTKVFGQSVLPEQAHYRIFFKFFVRNSNSMFYPRDLATKSELHNNAITPNGFYLDLANSKYLQLSIVREVLKDGATGLSEDVRFNRSAKDGDSFSDEGIYTITVTNQYTGRSTTKKIYIGDNNILKAYIATGLSISEIQDRIAMGATISDDGTIVDPIPVVSEEREPEEVPEVTEEQEENSSSETEYVPVESEEPEEIETTTNDDEGITSEEPEETKSSGPSPAIPIAGGAVAIAAVSFFIGRRKKSSATSKKGGE